MRIVIVAALGVVLLQGCLFAELLDDGEEGEQSTTLPGSGNGAVPTAAGDETVEPPSPDLPTWTPREDGFHMVDGLGTSISEAPPESLCASTWSRIEPGAGWECDETDWSVQLVGDVSIDGVVATSIGSSVVVAMAEDRWRESFESDGCITESSARVVHASGCDGGYSASMIAAQSGPGSHQLLVVRASEGVDPNDIARRRLLGQQSDLPGASSWEAEEGRYVPRMAIGTRFDLAPDGACRVPWVVAPGGGEPSSQRCDDFVGPGVVDGRGVTLVAIQNRVVAVEIFDAGPTVRLSEFRNAAREALGSQCEEHSVPAFGEDRYDACPDGQSALATRTLRDGGQRLEVHIFYGSSPDMLDWLVEASRAGAASESGF